MGEGSLPAVDQPTTRSPVKLEDSRRIRYLRSCQAEGLLRGFGGGEFDKAISSVTKRARELVEHTRVLERLRRIPGIAVANDLDLDGLADDCLKDILNEGFVHPTFHLPHPIRITVSSMHRGRSFCIMRMVDNVPQSLCSLARGRNGAALRKGRVARTVHSWVGGGSRGAGRREIGHVEKSGRI